MANWLARPWSRLRPTAGRSSSIQYGRYYSTKILSKPIMMILWSSVPMGSLGEFTLVFSSIWLTIWKSRHIYFHTVLNYHLCCVRVLIACIRDLGLCECPRCCTPISKFGEMGFFCNFVCQLSKLHIWTSSLCTVIYTTRGFIYQLGLGTTSAAVQNLLKPKSWTPTMVISVLYLHYSLLISS